jgi:N4-(beta-N-acetylglucosaminyl)-L-asparaginase
MTDRRRFLKASLLGASASMLAWGGKLAAGPITRSGKLAATTTAGARVVSTWDFGIAANQAAWSILGKGGHALDAVELGAQVPESDLRNHSVGKGGYPDRDGHVTLDASIMNFDGSCGAVAALEHIEHPISVARRVMERTPHVLLVGEGALQFALEQGFKKQELLTPDAEKAWHEWLKTAKYQPSINSEVHD